VRVAIVHSEYADGALSGENVTVEQQVDLLREAGHEVYVEVRTTLVERHRPAYVPRTAWRVASGRGGAPSAALADFAPDVVHLHNLFPNFGNDWLDGWDGPVVATLHNFRYGCANGLLLRDGKPCTDCLTGSSRAAVEHRCYRGSVAATLPLAVATRGGFAHAPVIQRADRLVALAPHAREVFVRFGAPERRIDVVPHGIAPRHGESTPGSAPPRFIAVGRLSPEKGFDRLLRDWPAGYRLDIVGDGGEAGALRRISSADVRFLGARDQSWRDEASGYTALVAPGVAWEAAVPRVAIEAWEAGLPVVAFDGGGAGAGVRSTGAGITYQDAASLAAALTSVVEAGDRLRAHARATYEASFTPAAWIRAMEATYRAAIEQRATSPVR